MLIKNCIQILNKFLLIAVVILIGLNVASAQSENTYKVSKVVSYNQAEFEVALNKCSFDNYRKMNSRAILKFEDGSEIELLSFNELDALGIKNDKTIVVEEGTVSKSIFGLHADGYIIETVAPTLLLEKTRLSK